MKENGPPGPLVWARREKRQSGPGGPLSFEANASGDWYNPVTGRRLVQGWQIESLLPVARSAYAAIETVLAVPRWREMRVRRIFADVREQDILAGKFSRRELAPFASDGDEQGFWIDGAAQVDVGRLLAASRAQWFAAGRLVERTVDLGAELATRELVVNGTGLAAA